MLVFLLSTLLSGCIRDSDKTTDDISGDSNVDFDDRVNVGIGNGTGDNSNNNTDIDSGNQTGVDECTNPAEKGVILSFDDRKNIHSWNESREYFNTRGVKATFFVDNWGTITDWEIEILRNLSLDGHEIGFHSTSHADYYDYLEQNLTAEDYLEVEILPGLESMKKRGFHPTSFAYPMGHRDVDLDKLILDHFSVIRGTRSNTDGSESWMLKCEDLRVYRSFPLVVEGDSQERLEDKEYWTKFALNEVQNNSLTLIFNGHGVEGGGFSTSIESLDKLIDEIERLELPYLLISILGE